MIVDISEKTGAKWHNLNIGIKISINSGTALLLFLGAFFLFLGFVALFPPVEKNFLVGLGGLTGAFVGYLKKRDSNNKIDLQAEKLKLGVPNGK